MLIQGRILRGHVRNRDDVKITNLTPAPFLKNRYTDKQICTRWYRPPEILLGLARYTPSIDVWGAGCIVAELFIGKAILQGDDKGSIESSDIEQYLKICELCGTPTASSWPSMNTLKDAATFTPKVSVPFLCFLASVRGSDDNC